MVFLLVVLMILTTIAVEVIILNRKKTEKAAMEITPRVFNKQSVLIPDGYSVSAGHTWAYTENDKMKVGIDNFVLNALGDVSVEKINTEGFVKKGEVIAEARAHGKVVKFLSPVTGMIDSVNNNLLKKKIEDPFGSDWFVKIKDATAEGLVSGSEAIHWMKNEFRRLKDYISGNMYKPAGVTMYDGGNLVSGSVSMLDSDSISEFEDKFLKF
jgi:glycine cleavage system H lipoate-binding protein